MGSPIRIFVCGTYVDLSAERGAVLDAILHMQQACSSMELFGARPECPLETCLAEVRRSDIIVVVVGNRYGTLIPGRELSFSEAEYDEAYRLNKPCLIYIRDSTRTLNDLSEEDQKLARLLENWKARLWERHTPSVFKETNRLAVRVVADLGREIYKLETSSGTHGTRNHRELPGAPSHAAGLRVRSSQSFGDQSRQLLHALSTDAEGNILILGDFWGAVDFGGPRLTSAGDRDIFLAKFDRNGAHLWSKRFGDEAEQVGEGLATDGEGAVYVAASFTGTLAFGGDLLVSKGRYNVALARFDHDGSHLWSRSFGDDKYHVPECIAVAPSGNVVIAGRFQGAIDFGSGRIESESQQTSIFVAAFSPSCECQWTKCFGGPHDQQARSLSIGPDGAIALAGVFQRSIQFGDQLLAAGHASKHCGFLSVLDEDGSPLWCKRFGEPDVEQGSVVAFDRTNGDLVAAGFIRSSLPSRASGQVESICVLARYDPAGILRWSKAFGTHVFPGSIAIAPDGRILLVGYFEKNADFGAGQLVSSGGYDIFAAVFSADGTTWWSNRFGDERQQFLAKGAYGDGSSIILAGSFHGTIDFGAGPLIASGYDGKQEGAEDVFLAIVEDELSWGGRFGE
jgi:hypothetical protein